MARRRQKRSRTITVKALQALKPGQATSQTLGQGQGSLQARGTSKGPRFFYRYGPKQERIELPAFNEQGQPLTIPEALEIARSFAARYQAGERDLKRAIEAERRADELRREAEEQAARLEAIKKTATLGALLNAYIAGLKSSGKVSAADTENGIANHVQAAFPELWDKPAADVSLDDVLTILEPLTTAGKLRTAAKVRAYIRAAYALAIKSRNSAQYLAFRKFEIRHNPAAETATIEGANQVRDRALSLAELRALWKRASRSDEPAGPLIRFYLLTGGQRFAQLRRAMASDLSGDRLTLWDTKGRRASPRRHVVPVIPEALAAIEAMRANPAGPHLVTLTSGRTPADVSATRKLITRLSAGMVAAGEVQEPFTLSALRSTVETRLAAAGIQSDTLAQLQSHGLSGVQWRHYNRHDYFSEKLEALERLRDLMSRPAATVHELRNNIGTALT